MSEAAYYDSHRADYGCFPDEDQGEEPPEISPDFEEEEETKEHNQNNENQTQVER